MHFGRLPAGPAARVELPPLLREGLTRRRLAVIGIGTAVTGFGAFGILARGRDAGGAEPSRVAPRADARAPERGTLEWALAQLAAEPDALLAAAGDLERVANRHARDVRLVPVFARLLDVALASRAQFADAAAACAIRALELLAGGSLLVPRRHAMAARRDFAQARKEFDYVLNQLARSAGR